MRIDPASGHEATELDLQAFLGSARQTKVGYVIAAYNDMTVIAGRQGEAAILIGLER